MRVMNYKKKLNGKNFTFFNLINFLQFIIDLNNEF